MFGVSKAYNNRLIVHFDIELIHIILFLILVAVLSKSSSKSDTSTEQ